MGMYIFEHPKTGKTVEIYQSVHDKHEYIDAKGIKWNRVYTVPQASIDSQIDPFSSKQFTEKTANKAGTVGDLWTRSAELSEKREKIAGKDAVKEKWFKNWSKERNGKKHPNDPSK